MKLEVTNSNYNAVVVRVSNLVPLEWCDNVVGLPIFWVQAIVSKDTNIWDIGILFSAEVQLSQDYCKNNNLYRHQENNLDKDVKGYFEDNWRVKAMKFRWHRSSAVFMPLSSLAYLGVDFDSLKEWDSFNEINWVEVCKKYIIWSKEPKWNHLSWKQKRFEKIDNKTLPEHLDSDNYFRNSRNYKDFDHIYVTQKLHGTSGRWWNCLWRRPLRRYEKLLSKLWIDINIHKYDSFYGSRRVIKNWMIKKQNENYYDNDVWHAINERIKHIIPQDWIIYWEIIWRDGDKPIQKGYTYNLRQWEMEIYVYRIAVVNQQGISLDLSWDNVKYFCANNWLKHVVELWSWVHKEFKVDDFMDKSYHKDWWINAVPLCKESPADEWVIVRKDGMTPYMTKAKCDLFWQHETKLLDEWIEDMESQES